MKTSLITDHATFILPPEVIKELDDDWHEAKLNAPLLENRRFPKFNRKLQLNSIAWEARWQFPERQSGGSAPTVR